MKRTVLIFSMIVALMFALGAFNVSSAKSSDYELANAWASEHCDNATIEKVVTKSKGGKKGVVCGTKYAVKYPKKVKKGKKVTVYMIEENGDIKAMVCLGKIK